MCVYIYLYFQVEQITQKPFHTERTSLNTSPTNSMSADCINALKSSRMSYILPNFTRYCMQQIFNFGR
ncbi:hypothetical protein HanPI659440_Chr03g0123001 [Helianthus annuus]|nr:hypothetical protein HanPI659440_Chr03g0123001 [Helianthus annuus]